MKGGLTGLSGLNKAGLTGSSSSSLSDEDEKDTLNGVDEMTHEKKEDSDNEEVKSAFKFWRQNLRKPLKFWRQKELILGVNPHLCEICSTLLRIRKNAIIFC